MKVKTPKKSEFEKWITARMISDRLYKHGSSTQLAALGDRLKVGLVTAAARHLAIAQTDAIAGPHLIPASNWKPLEALAHNDLWQTGQLTLYFQQDYRSARIRHEYYDVRFEPEGVDAMLVSLELPKKSHLPAQSEVLASPPKHAGGAPRKAFWDDLWAELCAQLLGGRLTPNRPADIERAMLDWASAQGHKLGETSVKEPAKKLFKAYEKEVKN